LSRRRSTRPPVLGVYDNLSRRAPCSRIGWAHTRKLSRRFWGGGDVCRPIFSTPSEIQRVRPSFISRQNKPWGRESMTIQGNLRTNRGTALSCSTPQRRPGRWAQMFVLQASIAAAPLRPAESRNRTAGPLPSGLIKSGNADRGYVREIHGLLSTFGTGWSASRARYRSLGEKDAPGTSGKLASINASETHLIGRRAQGGAGPTAHWHEIFGTGLIPPPRPEIHLVLRD